MFEAHRPSYLFPLIHICNYFPQLFIGLFHPLPDYLSQLSFQANHSTSGEQISPEMLFLFPQNQGIKRDKKKENTRANGKPLIISSQIQELQKAHSTTASVFRAFPERISPSH